MPQSRLYWRTARNFWGDSMRRIVLCKRCNALLSEAKLKRHALYCSRLCARRYQDERYRERTAQTPRTEYIPNATVGAAGELLVCSVLMMNGFHVFRSQSPACSCDVIAMKDNRIYRIEITTGYRGINGIAFPRHNTDNYDVMAIILTNKNNEIDGGDTTIFVQSHFVAFNQVIHILYIFDLKYIHRGATAQRRTDRLIAFDSTNTFGLMLFVQAT